MVEKSQENKREYFKRYRRVDFKVRYDTLDNLEHTDTIPGTAAKLSLKSTLVVENVGGVEN